MYILIKSHQATEASPFIDTNFFQYIFFYGPIHISNIWNSITARLYSSNSIKKKLRQIKENKKEENFSFLIVPWVPVPSIIASWTKSQVKREKKFTIQIFDINKIK